MLPLAFREVTPYSETTDRWNDITINAGASQSTLQDIKLPEVAGCFTYQNSPDLASPCSNRFIYWRTNHDVIELVEVSLDVNLQNNSLRLRFQNTPILRGVSIHEHRDQLVLLVATVGAIHKLVFPHPTTLERDDFLKKTKGLASPSVFHDTTSQSLRNRSCSFVLNNVSIGVPLPHTSCSWLGSNGNAIFILANSAGSVLMIVMSNKQDVEITTTELMKTGSIFRLLNGLVPTVMRSNRTEVALSIVCHKDESDVLIFSLFSDLQIRAWSHKKQECVLSESVLNFDAQKKLVSGNFTAHQCHLRKSASDAKGNFYLGVYVPIPHQKIFYLFLPTLDNDRYKLVLVSVLHQAQHDLVDFCIVEDRIWTLWLSCENQPVVLAATLDQENITEQRLSWLPVSLEPRVSSLIDCGVSNPQEVYMKEIFKIGRFLPSSISKAIGIYSSAKNSTLVANSFRKSGDLKSQVMETVASQILMKTGDIESSDDFYLTTSVECWARFFSYCIQYHEVGMKPLGISLDPKTGCVVIIKKNFFSLLCPCDSFDIIINPCLRSSYFLDLLKADDVKLYPALENVLTCVDLVRDNISNKQLQKFEDKVVTLYSPLEYALEIRQSLNLKQDNQFRRSLQRLVPSSVEIIQCLQYLLKKLDLTAEMSELPDTSNYSSFAGSSYGVGALCAGLAHLAKQRFEFCRDLLMFEFALYTLDSLDCEQLDNSALQSLVIPNTLSLLRSYYVVWWCTMYECSPVSASIQDAAFKQLCMLELPEFADADLTCIKSGQTAYNFFFQEDGGVKARKIMESKLSSHCANGWIHLFPSLVISAANLLWPLEGNLSFPEFLFSRCQYLSLQEYAGLLYDWSNANQQFLSFMVASSFLILGESKRALKIFLEIAREIQGESYLCKKLIKGRYSTTSSVMSQFFMRVIQMFEQFSLSECVISFTTDAINEVDKADSNIPIFYSVLFKHNLNLNRTEEAFATLLNNPDSSRRKDCLRQLIVRLCESKQFQKIIELSYEGYEDEIISILESRARCSDLCHNTSFYGVLYALHIDHRKFRKAAAIMYELAMRFGREVISLKGLKKQVSCYLATINCLDLAEPQYAWIVKPAVGSGVSDNDVDARSSPKRNSDGTEISNSTRPIKVQVLGLADIIKEYSLVQARLQHVRKCGGSSNIVITPLTSEETVALLLNGGLFETAIHLSKAFSLSLVPIFEALTYKCLSSTLRTSLSSSHELDKDMYAKSSCMDSDFSSNVNANQHIWNSLKIHLLEHETADKSELHRCVTEKLILHGAAVPAWLKLSYQKRNFTELLHLYISHGLFEDSIVLLTKYVKAVLGIRKEDFNLKFSLHVTSPAVWLPHTYIDILLDAIKELKDEHFKDVCQEFVDVLEEYNRTLESVSKSKLSKSITYSLN